MATPSSTSNRSKLRPALHQLTPSHPERDVEDEGDDTFEDDDYDDSFEEGQVDEDEEEENGDDKEAAAAAVAKAANGQSGTEARASTSSSSSASDADNYSQYISRHRSRYSYSPTLSPTPQQPAQTEQPRPPASPNRARDRPRSPLSITITNSHNQSLNTQQAGQPTSPFLAAPSHPHSPGSPLSPVSPRSPSPTSPHSPSVARLQVELAKARALIADRENDIKLAAQIGEMIMEENEKMEKMMIALKDELTEKETQEQRYQEEKQRMQKLMEDMRRQNMQLIQSSNNNAASNSDASYTPALSPTSAAVMVGQPSSVTASAALRTPSSSSSIQDFLRQELAWSTATTNSAATNSPAAFSSSSASTSPQPADEYTGDLNTDFRVFVRRLHAERRQNSILIGTLKDTVARLEYESEQKDRELQKYTDIVHTLKDRESTLQQQLSELTEKYRDNEVDALNDKQRETIIQKKHIERIIAQLENEVREEREEREDEQHLRRQAEHTILELRGKMEALQKQLLQQQQREASTAAAQQTMVKALKKKKAQRAKQLQQQLQEHHDHLPQSEISVIPTVTIPEAVAARPTLSVNVEPSPRAAAADSEVLDVLAALPTPSGSQSDEEHRQLLKQLQNYVTDVRQQLAKIRQDEEKRGRVGHDADTPPQAPQPEHIIQISDDVRAAVLAQQERERLAVLNGPSDKERLKDKQARERKRKDSQKEKEREREKEKQTLQEQAAAAEKALQQQQQQLAKQKIPAPLHVDTAAGPRSTRTDSTASASPSPVAADEPVTLAASTSIPTTANPALVVPGIPSFVSTPRFSLPNYEFSAIDHFTLTHIQSLLQQMWALALSLLATSPVKAADWYDNDYPACLHCHHKFNMFLRRHHCRLCGGIYCSSCSNHKVSVEKFNLKNARVCSTCFVMARTVVLCRQAVETGQVEYSEVVRQAEKYAERERNKAAAEREKAIENNKGQIVKEKKSSELAVPSVGTRVVTTPKGSLTLAVISPLSQDTSSTNAQTATSTAYSTPPRNTTAPKRDTPISPALVPFFAAVSRHQHSHSMSPSPTIHQSNSNKKPQRMMALLQQEKDKQTKANKAII